MCSTEDLGQMLIDAGWHQGSLFEIPSACFQWNELGYPGSEPLTVPKARRQKCDRLVLATQTCDLKSAKETRVEALACHCERNENFIASADSNNIRHFLIDPKSRLVAQAGRRLILAKAVLRHVKPEPWPSDPTRLDRFKDWLGRRYDRPALPDALVDAFQRPLQDALKQLAIDHSDTTLAFNTAIHELRVTMPSTDQPPYDLHLVAIIRDHISHDQADAIDTVMRVLLDSLNPREVNLNPEMVKRTEDEISLAEYRSTRPIFLEYLTYQGEAVEGAQPLRGV